MWLLTSGFWLPATELLLLAARLWLLASGLWLLAAWFWLLAAGFQLLATALWPLASGFVLLSTRLWLLAGGFWLLATGLWLLAAGLWLLAGLLHGTLYPITPSQSKVCNLRVLLYCSTGSLAWGALLGQGRSLRASALAAPSSKLAWTCLQARPSV